MSANVDTAAAGCSFSPFRRPAPHGPASITTLHKTIVTQQLMRSFLSAMKQEGFVSIDPWWLGREAMKMLKDGKRLSMTAEQSPPKFDLKLSQGDDRHA